MVLPLGYNKRFNKFNHVTAEQALEFFNHFSLWHLMTRIMWKNYVVTDHIRFIAEITPNPLYFGRSLFRSAQAFADPEEIEDIIWTKYYIASKDKKNKTISIIHESPPEKYEDIRQIYRDHHGVSNWCK